MDAWIGDGVVAVMAGLGILAQRMRNGKKWGILWSSPGVGNEGTNHDLSSPVIGPPHTRGLSPPSPAPTNQDACSLGAWLATGVL